MTVPLDERKDLDALSVRAALLMEEVSARHQYRARAVLELLSRIEDVMALVRNEGYNSKDALHLIECQCKRVRLIDAAINSR